MKRIIIICLVGLLILSSVIIINQNKENDVELNFNGILISSEDFKSIYDPLPEGYFNLCSIEQNKCTKMYKGNLDGR